VASGQRSAAIGDLRSPWQSSKAAGAGSAWGAPGSARRRDGARAVGRERADRRDCL